MIRNRKILVTGGAGFVGSFLVKKLLSEKNRVTVIDNISTGEPENLSGVLSKIDLVKMDLGRAIKTKIKLENFDYIFHLAGNPNIPLSVARPAYDFKLNLLNTFLLLEGMRKAKSRAHFIFASSAAVYGHPEKFPVNEEHPTKPITPYGASKLSAEKYAAVYSHIYNLKTTILRFFNIYGPRQKNQVIIDTIGKIRQNPQELKVIGDGQEIKDFIYIDDLVKAVILVAQKSPGKGDVYNIASGKHHSIKEVVAKICQVYQVKPMIRYSGKVRSGDTGKLLVDVSKIAKLGFRSKISLEQGIENIKQWLKEKSE